MNRDRYNRLVKNFVNKEYSVNLKTLQVICHKRGKARNKPLKYRITTQGRHRVRMLTDGIRCEYEMQEVIAVWLGKCIVDMRCTFLDDDNSNYHPSNLYWSNKKGGKRPELTGEKHARAKLTRKQIKEIKNIELPRRRVNGEKPKEILAKKYGVSIHTITNIRSNKGWNQIKICSDNRV